MSYLKIYPFILFIMPYLLSVHTNAHIFDPSLLNVEDLDFKDIVQVIGKAMKTLDKDVKVFMHFEEITFSIKNPPPRPKVFKLNCNGVKSPLCKSYKGLHSNIVAADNLLQKLEQESSSQAWNLTAENSIKALNREILKDIFLTYGILCSCFGSTDENCCKTGFVDVRDVRNSLLPRKALLLSIPEISKSSQSEEHLEEVWYNITKLQTDYEETAAAFTPDIIPAHMMNSAELNDVLMNLYQMFTNNQKRLGKIYRNYNKAAITCLGSKIPLEFVKPGDLKKSLFKLSAQLRYDHYELVFPPKSVDKYYQLPLATCTYDDNGGSILIRVPVKLTDKAYCLLNQSQGDSKLCSGGKVRKW